MKKVIIGFLLVGILIFMPGCSNMNTASKLEDEYYAMISMPDGRIMEGPCRNWYQNGNGLVSVLINDTWYRTNSNRIVIWK